MTTAAATDMLRRLASGCLDAVAPPTCALCGGATETGRAVCRACLPPVPEDRASCRRCGAMLGPHLPATDDCVHCRKDRFHFDAAVSLGNYEGPLRHAVLRGKARGGAATIATLTADLIAARGGVLRSWEVVCVTAVPRHWWRRARTDHDPAVGMARVLASGLGVPFRPGLLVQRRPARRQTGRTRTARKAALKDCFRAGRCAGLDGGTVVLCDDVLTTGTTASRCAAVLRGLGCDRVVVATLARSTGGSEPAVVGGEAET